MAHRLVVEVERGLDHVGRREREPLVQADILEGISLEDLKEAEGRVANVLDVVAEGAGDVAWERLSAMMRALSLPDPLTNITSDVVESPGGTLGGEESDAGLALTDSAVSSA